MDDNKQQEQYKPNKDRSFWSPTLLGKNKREDFFIRSTKILFWLLVWNFFLIKGKEWSFLKISWGISIVVWIIFYLSRRAAILNESEDRGSTD